MHLSEGLSCEIRDLIKAAKKNIRWSQSEYFTPEERLVFLWMSRRLIDKLWNLGYCDEAIDLENRVVGYKAEGDELPEPEFHNFLFFGGQPLQRGKEPEDKGHLLESEPGTRLQIAFHRSAPRQNIHGSTRGRRRYMPYHC